MEEKARSSNNEIHGVPTAIHVPRPREPVMAYEKSRELLGSAKTALDVAVQFANLSFPSCPIVSAPRTPFPGKFLLSIRATYVDRWNCGFSIELLFIFTTAIVNFDESFR